MSLLTPGFWPSTYWPDSYYADAWWPDYGTAAPYTQPAPASFPPPPLKSPITVNGMITQVWASWFTQIYDKLK